VGSQGPADAFSGAGPVAAVRPPPETKTLADDWIKGPDAHRAFEKPWTGRSRFEVSDGSWREVVHVHPEAALDDSRGSEAN